MTTETCTQEHDFKLKVLNHMASKYVLIPNKVYEAFQTNNYVLNTLSFYSLISHKQESTSIRTTSTYVEESLNITKSTLIRTNKLLEACNLITKTRKKHSTSIDLQFTLNPDTEARKIKSLEPSNIIQYVRDNFIHIPYYVYIQIQKIPHAVKILAALHQIAREQKTNSLSITTADISKRTGCNRNIVGQVINKLNKLDILQIKYISKFPLKRYLILKSLLDVKVEADLFLKSLKKKEKSKGQLSETCNSQVSETCNSQVSETCTTLKIYIIPKTDDNKLSSDNTLKRSNEVRVSPYIYKKKEEEGIKDIYPPSPLPPLPPETPTQTTERRFSMDTRDRLNQIQESVRKKHEEKFRGNLSPRALYDFISLCRVNYGYSPLPPPTAKELSMLKRFKTAMEGRNEDVRMFIEDIVKNWKEYRQKIVWEGTSKSRLNEIPTVLEIALAREPLYDVYYKKKAPKRTIKRMVFLKMEDIPKQYIKSDWDIKYYEWLLQTKGRVEINEVG